MPDRYDDWGNPVRPPPGQEPPLEYSIRGLARPLYRTFREYRAVILSTLAALALYVLLGSGGPRAPPVDWKLFAYVQYATDNQNLCNSFMVFETLHRLGSKADRVLMYPEDWFDLHPKDRNAELLLRAEKLFNVKMVPISIIDDRGKAMPGTLNEPSSWETAITKLRAFELDEYERVLYLDNDITLRQHLDELFLLPKTQMAMPRAYWDEAGPGHQPLSSKLMLLEPNRLEYQNFIDILRSWKLDPEYRIRKNFEQDLVNHRFNGSAMVLPHRPYMLLSSEFRRDNHDGYLGIHYGPSGHLPARMKWDAQRVFDEAKLIHFSDHPLPKPWIMWPSEGLKEIAPACGGSHLACPERKVWMGLYDEYRKRRKDVCRILSVPAPKWDNIRNKTYGE